MLFAANSETVRPPTFRVSSVRAIPVPATKLVFALISTVDVVIHKENYVYIRVDGIDMTQGDVALPVNQQFDRNYNGD